MVQMSVGNITVNVVRKAIKNIHLAVYPPAGRVRVATPLHVTDEALRLFIISKIAWINRQRRNFRSQERQGPREYVFRESHYYQGKRYLLRVIEQDGSPKVEIRNKIYLDLYVRKGSSLAKRHRVMQEWYRERLKEQIPSLIEKWQGTIGVEVGDWGVKQMKTRWGTCNIGNRRIWLNLELAKKPKTCLEYILVHELIHLLERHHNDRFMAYLDKFLPQWRSRKEELNRFPVSHAEWSY